MSETTSANPDALWVSHVDHRGVLLVFCATLVVELATSVLRWHRNKLSPRELELQQQHRVLLRKQNRLDVCSSFVELSQLQRKSVKIEKELGALKAARAPTAGGGATAMFFSVCRHASTLLFAWYWWGYPLVQFRPVRMWPVARMFSLPNLPAGAVHITFVKMLIMSSNSSSSCVATYREPPQLSQQS